MNCYLQRFFETGDIWLHKRSNDDAQNWKLHIDKTDSTLAFESVHWPGYYLGADHDVEGWLELRSRKKIKWTAKRTSKPTTKDDSFENYTISPYV